MVRKLLCINGTGKMLKTGSVYSLREDHHDGTISLWEFHWGRFFKKDRFKELVTTKITKKMVVRVSDNYVVGHVSESLKSRTEEEQIKAVVGFRFRRISSLVNADLFRIVEMSGTFYK